MTPPLPMQLTMAAGRIASWNDQGWGGRKGEIRMRIVRQSLEAPLEETSCFGIAPHNAAPATCDVAEMAPSFIRATQPGDRIEFIRYMCLEPVVKPLLPVFYLLS